MTNTALPKIGDRAMIGGFVCTIKYLGTISVWNDEMAVGVEWDEPERGKNSGAIDDHFYFEVNRPGSGSFFKLQRFLAISAKPETFLSALKSRYGEEIPDRAILARCAINEITTDTPQMPNLKVLNLQGNLLNSLDDILRLLQLANSVTELNLSHNRWLSKISTTEKSNLPSLIITDCDLDPDQMSSVLQRFKGLNKLDVSGNFLSIFNDWPLSITNLSLSRVGLQQFPDISMLSLEILDISTNKISSVPKYERSYEALTSLSLQENQIKNLAELEKLSINFPKLKRLNIDGNPCCQTEADSSRIIDYAIGLFAELESFNEIDITSEIRYDSEVHYITKVLSSDLQCDLKSKRWNQLRSRYPELIGTRDALLGSQNTIPNLITVRFINETKKGPYSFDVQVLVNYSVRYLMGRVSHIIGIPVYRFRLHYQIDERSEAITREFSPISDFNIADGETLHIKPSEIP